MPLNDTQRIALKADALATPELATPIGLADWPAVAAFYNATATPDYWVWRSVVARAEIYNQTSPTGSTWDWTTYKNQGVSEQNAWVQMFMGDVANFSLVNLRAGIGKIFTGSAQANAQRDHALAMGRRLAKRAEKLFAVAVVNPPANTGNNSADARGAATNPDVMTFEGNLTASDVQLAMTN